MSPFTTIYNKLRNVLTAIFKIWDKWHPEERGTIIIGGRTNNQNMGPSHHILDLGSPQTIL